MPNVQSYKDCRLREQAAIMSAEEAVEPLKSAK